MSKGRCLGLVGGLGVGATAHYYRKLAKGHQEQNCTLDVVIAHAETARVFEYVSVGDRKGLAEYLNGFIRRLERAGAEFAAIPAITPYFCAQELRAVSPLPLLDIFGPLVAELTARKARRVAVFGTRFVIESALFGYVKEVEFVLPARAEIDYIHHTYVELAAQGQESKEKHAGLTALAHTLVKRERLDAIILAGTDLALLFNEENTDFPHFDCAALHIKAILNGLLNDVA